MTTTYDGKFNRCPACGKRLLPVCHWSCAPEGYRGRRKDWRERRKIENRRNHGPAVNALPHEYGS